MRICSVSSGNGRWLSDLELDISDDEPSLERGDDIEILKAGSKIPSTGWWIRPSLPYSVGRWLSDSRQRGRQSPQLHEPRARGIRRQRTGETSSTSLHL